MSQISTMFLATLCLHLRNGERERERERERENKEEKKEREGERHSWTVR